MRSTSPPPSRLWRAVRAVRRTLGVALRFSFGVSIGAALVGTPAAAYAWWWFDKNVLDALPNDLSEYRTWRPPTSVQVNDRHGETFDTFFVERRVWVDLDTLPPVVWQAFIAAEDRRFFDHPGVDVLGIGRAVLENYRAGSKVQGASTLTQQLVKNLITGDERSYERKVREAVLAWRLERELGKERVLELYLNYVFLGSGNYGIEAAAQDYFDVSAAELNAGQAAMIAGLVPAPSRYNPRRSRDLAKSRRAIVLRGMVEAGFLDPIDALDYLTDPVLEPRKGEVQDSVNAAYKTMVRREVRRLLGPEAPFDAGLVVATPYDPAVQAVAKAAVVKAVDDHLDRQGPLAVIARTTADPAAFLAAGDGLARVEGGGFALPPSGGCFSALVPAGADLGKLRAGSLTVSLLRADRSALVHDERDSLPKPLQNQLRGGERLALCVKGDEIVVNRVPWAQAATVVLDHRTGEVLSVVGGTETVLEGFVRATQARRQPGSSFKPYVYAAAFDDGRSGLDVMVDAPLTLGSGAGAWSPKNYAGSYSGAMTLKRALAVSVNTIAVRLAMEVGPARVADLARDAGVRTPLRTDLTMALGSSEVTPMDQALGYATFARLGVPTDPVYITMLTDSEGMILARPGDVVAIAPDEATRLPGGADAPVMSAGTAYAVVDALREVVRAGTGRRAYRADRDRAGKTGTTNNYVDAWFVGLTARYAIAVWVGSDGTRSLGDRETGGRAALPAWISIADSLDDVAGERLPFPDEAVWVRSGDGWTAATRGRVPVSALATPRVGDEPLPLVSR